MGAVQSFLQNPVGALIGALVVALVAELVGRWLSGRRAASPLASTSSFHASNTVAIGTQDVRGESRTNQNITNTGYIGRDMAVTSVDNSRTTYDQRKYHRTEVRGPESGNGGDEVILVLVAGFVMMVATAAATLGLARHWDTIHLWSSAAVLGMICLVAAFGRGAPGGPAARPGNPALCAVLGVLIVVDLAFIPFGSSAVLGYGELDALTSGQSFGDGTALALQTVGGAGVVVYLARLLGLGVLIALFVMFALRGLGAAIVSRDLSKGRPAQAVNGWLRRMGAQRLDGPGIVIVLIVALVAGAATVPGAVEWVAGRAGALLESVTASLN